MAGILSIPVEFEHRRWDIPDEVLRRFGSPHFSRPEAGRAVELLARRDSTSVSTGNHVIDRLAIIAANEAYAEAAVADPISDLLVWSDWRSGKRRFPYAGQYVPLDISTQQPKAVATSALGVLGEAVTGLYAQAGIGVSPLVRVIGRWPDLIFDSNTEIHFVEAKATTSEEVYDASGAMPWVSPAKLQELLLNAIQQFGADPWVTIWGSFVTVTVPDATQLNLKVTLLELSAAKRRSAVPRKIPQLLWDGLARRAVARALASFASDADAQVWRVGSKKRSWNHLNGVRRQDLQSAAMDELNRMIQTESPRLMEFADAISSDLERTIALLEPGKELPGRLDRMKLGGSAQGMPLREIGSQVLMTRPVSDEQFAGFLSSWKQDWSSVSNSLPNATDTTYRAGGNLYWAVPITRRHFDVEFHGYWREPNIAGVPDTSGVFLVYSCVYNPQNKAVSTNRLLYVGEGEMMCSRIKRHEKLGAWREFLRDGEELCFSCAHVGEAYRHRILAALINRHQPPCNHEYGDYFPFDETTVQTTGKATLIQQIFTVGRKEPTPVV